MNPFMKTWHDNPLRRNRVTHQPPSFDAGMARNPQFDHEVDLLLNERNPELEAEFDLALADQDLLAAVLAQTGEIEAVPGPATGRHLRAEPSAPVSWTLPGFEGECRVTTNFGELPIKALRRRDMIKTISGAYKEVKKVDAFRLDADFMARHPAANPVMIRARSIGGSLPTKNMLVSPGQKLWLSRAGAASIARTAEELEGSPGVQRMRRSDIVYYRFHCGSEEKVCVEGAWFLTAPD